MLALHGRELEEAPVLTGVDAKAAADAALQATHDESLIPLLTELTLDDLLVGGVGLVVLTSGELDDLVMGAEDEQGSPRGWWIAAVEYGDGRWLLYPDDDQPVVRFTVFAPIPVGDRAIGLWRLNFAVDGLGTAPERDTSVDCLEVVEGLGRRRISRCDPINCAARCRLTCYVEGRARTFACSCR